MMRVFEFEIIFMGLIPTFSPDSPDMVPNVVTMAAKHREPFLK